MNSKIHNTINSDKVNFRELRRKYSSKFYKANPNLIDAIRSTESHSYLVNPAGINAYLYFTHYIEALSKLYFEKSFGEVKILDWGCGKGHNSYLLNELGANLVSCDLKGDDMHSTFGQKTPIIDHFEIDVLPLTHEYILPFKSDSFDIVLSFGVLEHVSHDFESLEEINRVLKSGGLFLCFFLPYFMSWTQPLSKLLGHPYHDKLYSKEQVYKLLHNSNFDLYDIWHRQLFPKNSVRYPFYKVFERIDQFLTNYTPLRYFVTNIEFVAVKK